MVAILEKSDAAQGFEQIIDFLSESCIHHALTVNPHVYILCIKQFWNTAMVKRSGDVTSSAMASALICLSSGQRFNFSKYISESLVRNVDSTSKFYMYPRVGKGFSGVETPLFENMLAVRAVDAEEEVQVPAHDDVVQEHVIEEIATKVVSPTPTSPSPSSPVIPSTPPHQSPSSPPPQAAKGSSHLVQQVLDKCFALVLRVKGLENANTAQQLEIIKLKARMKKLERLNKVKSSKLRRLKKVGTSQRVESLEDVENVFNQGRISVDMETNEGIELEVDQEKDAEVQGRQADTQAEIYNIDLDHSSKVAAASAPILAAKPKVLKIAAAPAVSTRRRKGVVNREPKEELHTDTPAETPTVKDKGKGILIEDPNHMKKKDQIEIDVEYAKKLQEELEKEHEEAYKQIDWNAAFDHVQAKETQRKLSEEAQEADDLRGRLEIVQDEDDDVFVEATPLAQKVPVVDYQVLSMQEDDTEVQEAVEIITTAKLMSEVVTTAATQTPLFENMLAVRAVDADEEVQVPAQDDVVQEHVIKEIATEEDTEVQEAVEVVTTAKLITKVVTASATQVAAASTPIPAAKPKVLKIVAAPAVSTKRRKGVVIRDPEEELHIDTPTETPTVKDKGKGILIEGPKSMKKKDQIEMDAEYAKKLQEELEKEHEEAYKKIDWNANFDHVQAKETQYIKRYHEFKKKPQSESEARKNMISYLKNTEGYKMKFFKGKTYD
nr:hypothetical protein [Tanacetum cinerariifolium]